MKSTSRKSKNIRVPCQATFQCLPAVLANQGVPVDWNSANVMPIYQKGWNEDVGNYRPVSLTSGLGKTMEQIILSSITSMHRTTRPSQHGFRKGRSYLTNLISFYSKVTHCVDEGKRLWLLTVWTSVKSLMLLLTTFWLQLLDQKLLSFQCSSLLEGAETKNRFKMQVNWFVLFFQGSHCVMKEEKILPILN